MPWEQEEKFESYISDPGLGTAWGGRLFCKQDIQMGSIPIRSIRVSSESANAADCKSALFGGNGLDTHLAHSSLIKERKK